jgi:SNF2 family DNA or RNA helicase
MDISLLPHQAGAIKRLTESGGCNLLANCPGSGKTLTALHYVFDVAHAKRILIVAPASVLGVWQDECRKWEFPVPTAYVGTKQKRESLPLDFTVISYEMLLREWRKFLTVPASYDAILIDESQKIKNPTAKISKLLRLRATNIPCRVLLTGTPVMNTIADLWNQAEIVHPGVLGGNWYSFRSQYAIMPIAGTGFIAGWRNKEEILEKVKPWIFSVPADEIRKNLPTLTITEHLFDLSPAERKAYDQIRDEMRLEMDDGEELTVPNALVLAGRLRQATSNLPVLGVDCQTAKAKVVKELVESLGDEKVIIFTHYAETAKLLRDVLACKHLIIGESSGREAIIQDWKDEGAVLIGNSAMYAGLNLQCAHYVIFAEVPWNWANFEQAYCREFRTGQKNPVTVYVVNARNTIDEGVWKLINKKKQLGMDVEKATTVEDIRDLINL